MSKRNPNPDDTNGSNKGGYLELNPNTLIDRDLQLILSTLKTFRKEKQKAEKKKSKRFEEFLKRIGLSSGLTRSG